MAGAAPQKQLDGFIAKYSPAMQKHAKAAIKKMRARLPGAVEMVYDNYQWLVVGYGPSDRASEALFSLAFAPNHVTLCFLRNGPRIPDPRKMLRGSGTRVRNVRLVDGIDIDMPAVQALMRECEKLAGDPIPSDAPRITVIKSVSKKQRPRRPSARVAKSRARAVRAPRAGSPGTPRR
jgi:hypothetical protein